MLRRLRNKAIALGLVLGISGSANAQIAPDELFFTAFDFTSKNSFTLDLNIPFNSFQAGTSFSPFNLTTLASWNTFLGLVTGPIQWTIAAVATSPNRILVSGGPNPPGTMTGGNANGYNTRVNTVRVNANGAGNTDLGVINGPTNYSGATIGLDGRWAGTIAYNTTGLIPSTLNLSIFPIVGSSQGTFAGTAMLDGNNVLSVTAVPEPSTYAMMLAGLMVIGAIARRRLGQH